MPLRYDHYNLYSPGLDCLLTDVISLPTHVSRLLKRVLHQDFPRIVYSEMYDFVKGCFRLVTDLWCQVNIPVGTKTTDKLPVVVWFYGGSRIGYISVAQS